MVFLKKKFLISWCVSTIISILILIIFKLTGWRKYYSVAPYSFEEILLEISENTFFFFGFAILMGLFYTITVCYKWWK